jgi:hypothetical protein
VARRLTAQDKLALALTSAGSQRRLAAQLGITHQKLGRWLREGEAGGIKAIPTDIFTRTAIDLVFADHRKAARARARKDQVPYNADVPAFMIRKPLSTGQMGDRVFVEHTEFIKRDVREQVFQGAVDSQRFYAGSVRSVVNLRSYFRGVAAEEIRRRHRTDVSVSELTSHIQRDWIGDEKRERGRIIDPLRPFPLFTMREGLKIGSGDPTAVRGIERQLREKHEPATGQPGTVAADEYLFQLIPADYEEAPAGPTRKRRNQRVRAKK